MRRDGHFGDELSPGLSEFLAKLTDAGRADPEFVSQVEGTVTQHHLSGDPSFLLVQGSLPRGEVETEMNLFRHWGLRVVHQGGLKGVALQGAEVGELRDHEGIPLLGHEGESVLRLLLPAKTTAIPNGLGGEGCDDGGELGGVFSLFDESEKPLP